MQSFFVLHSHRDRPLAAEEVSNAEDRLAAALTYARHLTQRRTFLSRSRTIALLLFSNEPRLNLWQSDEGRIAFASGYTTAGSELLRSPADGGLASVVGGMSGRFSAVVFDPAEDRIAVANSTVRVDPVFVASGEHWTVLGTQASAVARLVGDGLAYDHEALFSFINTGFFGCDDTPFSGVRCLPAASTWHVERGAEREQRLPIVPPTAKGDPEALAAALTSAVGQMNDDAGPIALGLTGGKDSRLMLAAVVKSGLRVECTTRRTGAWSYPDVHMGSRVAALVGVPHRVQDIEPQSGPLVVDYLARAALNLKATDGGIFAFESIRFDPKFSSRGGCGGLGGETLRGGYADHHRKVTRESAVEIARRQFGREAELFTPAAAARYATFLDRWMDDRAELAAHDLLDRLYAEFRCGRWTAASTRSTAMFGPSWLPYLDNRFAATVSTIPARDRVGARLLQDIVRVLDPRLADLPLADQFWPGTPKEEQERIRAALPLAFTAARDAGSATDWRRSFPDPLTAHVRRYCLDEGRLKLLAGVLRTDAVAALLRGGRELLTPRFKLIHGIYSACVLVSGDWLRTPPVSERLELSRA